jgi:ribosome maturation factor RimP
MYQKIIERVGALAAPILDELGLELVDLQLGNEQGGFTLRLTIYKPEGIDIDDCSRVSRELGQLLEIEDPIKKAFRLEVSSPGLTRPLVTERDFARNCGKKVKIKFVGADGSETITGSIGETDADKVKIIVEGQEEEILLTKIHKAKLVIEF